MTETCYNEKCQKPLEPGHKSWFCSEECKKEYWGEAYYPGKTKTERTFTRAKDVLYHGKYAQQTKLLTDKE